MAKYKVVQNGERVPSGEPIFQVTEIIDGEEVIVNGNLMTKKEAQDAMKALSPAKKPDKKTAKKKAKK
jgi:hypothetical protein